MLVLIKRLRAVLGLQPEDRLQPEATDRATLAASNLLSTIYIERVREWVRWQILSVTEALPTDLALFTARSISSVRKFEWWQFQHQ